MLHPTRDASRLSTGVVRCQGLFYSKPNLANEQFDIVEKSNLAICLMGVEDASQLR
jgi:hypothetical protein